MALSTGPNFSRSDLASLRRAFGSGIPASRSTEFGELALGGLESSDDFSRPNFVALLVLGNTDFDMMIVSPYISPRRSGVTLLRNCVVDFVSLSARVIGRACRYQNGIAHGPEQHSLTDRHSRGPLYLAILREFLDLTSRKVFGVVASVAQALAHARQSATSRTIPLLPGGGSTIAGLYPGDETTARPFAGSSLIGACPTVFVRQGGRLLPFPSQQAFASDWDRSLECRSSL